MLKRSLLTSALFLSFSIAHAQRTAVVQYQTLLSQIPEAKAADAELKKLGQQYIGLLQQMERDYNIKSARYDSSFKSLSPELQAEAKDDLARMQQEYQKLNKKGDSVTRQKAQLLLTPVQKKLNDAIAKVAAAKKIMQVWDANTQGLIYASKSEDITEDVMAELGLKK